MPNINIFPWDKNFATGLDIVDEQHQKLVEIINHLATELTFSPDHIDLDTIFNDLIDYTHYHFETEEAIWQEHLENDESTNEHKKTHQQFIETVKALVNEQEGKSATEVAENTLGVLVQWLVAHILESDRYMAYLTIELREGKNFEEAKERAKERMSGHTRQMIDIVIRVYDALASNTLKLMHELDQQQKTKTKLDISEERLSFALSGSNDGLWDWNTGTNEVYFSPRWFEMLGYEFAELPVEFATWETLLRAEDIVPTMAIIQDYLEGHIDKFEVEFKMKHKEGHWVDILSRARFAKDEKGNVIEPKRLVGTHVDITERIRQEGKIRLEQQRYKALLDTMGEGFWLIDQSGILLEVNDSYCMLSGYTKEELIGKHISFLEAIHDEEQIKANIAMIKATGKAKFESQHRRKDGIIWDVEVSVSYSDVEEGREFVIIRDITRQKAVEKDLQELNKDLENRVQEKTREIHAKNQELENYINTIQSILLALNTKGEVTLISPSAEKMLGYAPGELLGKNWFETCLPAPEGMDEVYPYFLQLMSGDQTGLEYHENHIVVKDGSLRYVAWHNALLRDEHGHITGILTSGMDITEQKLLETQLREAKQIAENASKIKSDFLANMSHEIRTPMNSVIGMTDLALESDLNERQKNYVQKANKAAKNLLGIINDILDFSKMESGKLEFSNTHFEFRKIISTTLHLISVAAKDKNLKTKIKIAQDVPGIYYADELRLGQVLTNLANNAVKFSKQGGAITLSISLLEENESDARLLFSIEDEGIGISQENQKKLFQSFSQAESSTSRKFGGTGLGLAISKKIVELMDGEIWLESEEGKGSTFFFTVRIQKSDQDALIESTSDIETAMKLAVDKLRGSSVLLVEDNDMNQELAQDLLTRNGIRVTIANNGQEALDILRYERFDGILMDCQMPIMDGYEATRKIRMLAHYNHLPILAMTANAMEGDRKQAIDAGMNDHIAKPINPTDMFITMAKWIKKRS